MPEPVLCILLLLEDPSHCFCKWYVVLLHVFFRFMSLCFIVEVLDYSEIRSNLGGAGVYSYYHYYYHHYQKQHNIKIMVMPPALSFYYRYV